MNASEFVNALGETCRDSAVASITTLLEKPPGRKAPNELKELSAWYNALSHEEKTRTAAVMRLVADSTLFGVLCVLDGVRAVESSPDKSAFRLTVSRGKVSRVLAPGSEFLHDIYRSHP